MQVQQLIPILQKMPNGSEVGQNVVDILSNAGSLWKSVKNDGLPEKDKVHDMFMYSEKHDEMCVGWWHDGEFDPSDTSLYYLRTEKSISHYLVIAKP